MPIAQRLLAELEAQRGRGSKQDHLVFGRGSEQPFNPATIVNRARRAWASAGLTGLGLHDCRHTFASLMIAAGVNAKALSVFMGHASITITLDRYGHLFPGSEDEAALLLDAYLVRSDEADTTVSVQRASQAIASAEPS